MLPITLKTHSYFYSLQGLTWSGTYLFLHLFPHHSLPAHSCQNGIFYTSNSPSTFFLFPPPSVWRSGLCLSHLYNKIFPDHPAKVASKPLLLNNTYYSWNIFCVSHVCTLLSLLEWWALWWPRPSLSNHVPLESRKCLAHNIGSINVMD